MPIGRKWRAGVLAMVAGLLSAGVALCQPANLSPAEIARVDLAKLFGARSAWSLIATQGPPAVDYADNAAPGAVRLCLEKGPSGACQSEPAPMPPPQKGDTDDAWAPHYLRAATAVYPRGRSAPPLLLIVTASLYAGDGDQRVVTQLFRYQRSRDVFERAYVHTTGANNNEEVRFIPGGPLMGDVISVEPTENAPYAYWIEVERFEPGRAYKPVLKYRSATRYADGNRLAVIDSEMPNIERRLGLWRPGSPLPLPTSAAKSCLKPRLKNGELWCD